MKQLIIIFFLFFILNNFSFGQIKTFDIPIENGDTSLWYKWKHRDIKQMDIPDLRISSDNFHFRFWTEIQIVDIWTNDFKTINGFYLNYTIKTTNNKKNPTKIFFNKTSIDTVTARKIYNLLVDNLIFQIPSDYKINGWNQGDDGEEFLMEYSTKTFYTFKEFWTPSAYKDIKEAIIIDDFTKKLKLILNFDENWNRFIHGLPRGCYRAGEITQICI